MAYAMFVNLFLLGAEVFKEVYSQSQHVVHFNYLFVGIGEPSGAGPVRVDRGRLQRCGFPAIHQSGHKASSGSL